MTTKTEKKFDRVWLPLLFVVCAVGVILFSMSKINMQFVDSESQRQPLICDNTSRTITFKNYVTAYSWLEQVRWADTGATYNISTHFTIGEPLLLTYRCT